MGVYSERYCCATCDNCGHYTDVTNMKLIDFKKKLRNDGWRIGELTFCPECAETTKGQCGVKA